MAYVKRSEYEFGDDPIRHRELLAEERRDHAEATARGERLRIIAHDVVRTCFDADSPRAARIDVFHVLASYIYPGRSVDIPANLGDHA